MSHFRFAVGILAPDGAVFVAFGSVYFSASGILIHVAVRHVGVGILHVAHDAAHVVVAPYGGGSHEETLRYGSARMEFAHDAANLLLVRLDDALERTLADGGAHVRLAGNAAHIVGFAQTVAEQAAVRHVAVLNVAHRRGMVRVLRNLTHDETEIVVVLREQRRIGKREVRHRTVLDVAEETGILLVLYGKAVNGVAFSVELAAEGAALRTDRREVARARHVDVAHEACFGGSFAAVHLGGKLLEVGGSVDFVVTFVTFNVLGLLLCTANGVDARGAFLGGVEADAVCHGAARDAHRRAAVLYRTADAAHVVRGGNLRNAVFRSQHAAVAYLGILQIAHNAAGTLVVRHHVAAHGAVLHGTLVAGRTADATHHVPLLLALERNGRDEGVAHVAVAHHGVLRVAHDDSHLLSVDVLRVFAVVERDDGVAKCGFLHNHVLDGRTVGASEETCLYERPNLQPRDDVVLSVELTLEHVCNVGVARLHTAYGPPARVGERGEVDVGIESAARFVVAVVDEVGEPLQVFRRLQAVVPVGVLLSHRFVGVRG